MKLVKLMADDDGEVVPTPGEYNDYCYMLALPEQAGIVLRSSVQSAKTALGTTIINQRELAWLEENVNMLPVLERPMAKTMFKSLKKARQRYEEDTRDTLNSLGETFRLIKAEQKQPV